jgi:hypothetical protein
MKPTLCVLLVVCWFDVSLAQIPNIPINTQYTHQAQPSIASSPTYDFLLCASWLRMDLPIPPSTLPTFYVGWALSSADTGSTWDSYGYFDHGVESSVAFDRHGPYETSVHCVFSSVDANGFYGQINHTLNEEFTGWSTPARVSNSTFGQRDPKMTIDNNPESNYEGRVYVTWSDGWSRILFRASSNRGATWGSEIVITATGDDEGPDAASWYSGAEFEPKAAGTVRYPDITVAPNGDIYVAWFEFDFQGPYTGRIPVRRSTDGGDNFQSAVTAGDNVDLGVCFVGNARPPIRPSLAASPNGSIFMITNDRKTLNDPDPYLRFFRSTNNGSSWTETWNLTSPSGQQDFFPQVVVTPDERVSITYMHSTASQSCSYGTNSVATWTAISYDNGSTFGTPR